MRSVSRWAVGLLALQLASAGVGRAAPGEALSDGEIAAAVDSLRRDGNLAHKQRTTRTLRWKRDTSDPRLPEADAGWAAGMFEFLAGGAKLLVWIAGALAAAIGLVWIVRVLRVRVPGLRRVVPAPASHVQDLDVQPAALPADIGAAAAALLAAGQLREALALLYRGALSRAIHRHGIAIAESSTEGEVLSTVAPRLAAPGARYLGRLVALRQRATYAAELPAVEAVAELCRDFPLLDRTGA